MELIWRLTKPHGAKLEAKKTRSDGAMSYLSHTETLDFSSGSIESVFGSDPNGFLGSGSGSVWIFPYDWGRTLQKTAHFLYHLCRPFSLRVFKLGGITIPPFDRKFSVDLENGVIFEIEGARFWDIHRFVQHGKFALLWGQLTNTAAMELIWRLTKPYGAHLEANKTTWT